MNVVGLDLSLTATGVATAHGTEVLSTKLKGCERLAWVRDEIMRRLGPSIDLNGSPLTYVAPDTLVVIEDYAYSRANQAHQIGELHGVIRLALHEAGVPMALVAPTARAKYATGSGRAGKSEVLAAAIRRLGYEGHDDNEADALWLRTMALDHYGLSRITMPTAHREGLDKVDWPELAVSA